jgi:transposase
MYIRLMERRVMGNYQARCEAGEKKEITSNSYLSLSSSKTCHACGWKWEDMELSDRIFLCQNLQCSYHLFAQDRDHNAALNILREALRLIGLIDQVVTDIGSGDDVNSAVDLM